MFKIWLEKMFRSYIIIFICCKSVINIHHIGMKWKDVMEKFDFFNSATKLSQPVSINITQVPFMARFEHTTLPIRCNAAIISKRYLVTAARCNSQNTRHKDGNYVLTVGTAKDPDSNDVKSNNYEIEKIITHPKFRDDSMDYDIAVIKLKQKMAFDNRVNIVPMASLNDKSLLSKPDELVFSIFGYGFKMNNDEGRMVFHRHLFRVRLPFVTKTDCQKYLYESPITNQMICVGDIVPNKSASCNFGFGSPLLFKGQLWGVMSFAHDGYPCSLPGFPTVFASVPKARDFIDSVIKNKKKAV